jgi:ribulose 1,5-bisphosphate synthetase/thiazole synthase
MQGKNLHFNHYKTYRFIQQILLKMTQKTRIIVIGAGIGGLTAGALLANVKGMKF